MNVETATCDVCGEQAHDYQTGTIHDEVLTICASCSQPDQTASWFTDKWKKEGAQ